jgi:CRISPR-associated exonuclease Cas4
MYPDEDLIPISALQHHLFCPRQCALIHVDGLWAENRLTAEGKVLHERSDTPGRRTRPTSSGTGLRPVITDSEDLADGTGAARSDPGVHTGQRPVPSIDHVPPVGLRTVRALPLLNRRLGLTGKADQVEIPVDAGGHVAGPLRPVEHKRGSPKRLDHDRVQLAAQALCLEEMFQTTVREGELFYHAVRRRERVEIDARLRDLVVQITAEVRANIAANTVPPAKKQAKCKSCSLLHLCLPAGTGPTRTPALYLSRSLAASLAATNTTDSIP